MPRHLRQAGFLTMPIPRAMQQRMTLHQQTMKNAQLHYAFAFMGHVQMSLYVVCCSCSIPPQHHLVKVAQGWYPRLRTKACCYPMNWDTALENGTLQLQR